MADIKNRLTMDTRQYQAGVTQAKNSMRSWRTEVGTASQSLTSMVSTMRTVAGVITSVFVAGAMARAIRSLVDFGDELGKMSTRLQISVDDLTALQFVAERSGTSFESTTKAIQLLQKNLLDFTRGTGEARLEFEDLGFTMQDAARLLQDPLQAYLEVGSAIGQVEESGKRLAISQRILGKAGAEQVQVFAQGREAIDKLIERQRFLAGSQELFAKRSEAMNDALTDVTTAGTALLTAFLTPLLPALTNAATALADFLAEVRQNDLPEFQNDLRLTKELIDAVTIELVRFVTLADITGSQPQAKTLIDLIFGALAEGRLILKSITPLVEGLTLAFSALARGDLGLIPGIFTAMRAELESLSNETEKIKSRFFAPTTPTLPTDQQLSDQAARQLRATAIPEIEGLQTRSQRLQNQATLAAMENNLQLARTLLLEANTVQGRIELLQAELKAQKAGRELTAEEQVTILQETEIKRRQIVEKSNADIAKTADTLFKKQHDIRIALLKKEFDEEVSRRGVLAEIKAQEARDFQKLINDIREQVGAEQFAEIRFETFKGLHDAREALKDFDEQLEFRSVGLQRYSQEYQAFFRLEAELDRKRLELREVQAQGELALLDEFGRSLRGREVILERQILDLQESVHDFPFRRAEQAFRTLGGILNNTIDEMVRGLLRGTQTIEELWRNLLLNTMVNILSRTVQHLISTVFEQLAATAIGRGVGSAFVGLLAQTGGIVRRFQAGTGFVTASGPGDIVPALLHRGEGIINPTGMRILDQLNSGQVPGIFGGGSRTSQPVINLEVQYVNPIDPRLWKTTPGEIVNVVVNNVRVKGGAIRQSFKEIK